MRRFEHVLAGLMLAGLVTLAGCGSQDSGSEASPGRIHPIEENIPGPRSAAFVMARQPKPASPAGLADVAERLEQAERVLQVGALEGSREEMIGAVEDVEAGPDGSILVLDAQNKEVRIYDDAGRLLRWLGQPGQGPGEFLEPEELERDRSGRILVADRDGSIAIFSDTTLIEEISSNFIAEYFCAGDTALFATGMRSEGEGVIHELSRSGEIERSIGQRYQAENQMVTTSLSEGPLVCDLDRQRLVFAFNTAPYIYGYAPDGEIAWMTRIADFQSMEIEEYLTDDGRRGMRYRFPDSHLMLRMTGLPGGYVLAQVAWRTSRSMQTDRLYAELHSYLLESSTGEGKYLGSNLPLVYDATETRLYAGTNHPYPQVFVYTY